MGSPRVFRTPRWVVGVAGAAFVAGAAATAFTLRVRGVDLLGIGLGAFCLLALVGLLDALRTRIELHEDVLVVVRNLRRRTVPRDQIGRVTWAWGGPVFLVLVDGSRLDLPDTGNSQSRTNSIRAWVKRAGSASETAGGGVR